MVSIMVGKPVGEYASFMLDPGGWPNFPPGEIQGYYNEMGFRIMGVGGIAAEADAATEELLTNWTGLAANAAAARVAVFRNSLMPLQSFMVRIRTWYAKVATDVRTMQLMITASVESAEAQIQALQAGGPENEPAIAAIVAQRLATHVQMVESLAARINASAGAVLATAPAV
ncbi:hypothetical protein MB901379_03058 [Mycobacterium basiliense]|uniref:Uncharacterized protein n=1 Tax=Mycobacterium basiliense TaxID=2094119 RepID=A0A3S4BXB3_9MYCO|nr:hypothetical protein [Mycobacterium basiliense]VDM89481.1 hypothetical protein MB901379_03058 [Mycobacterium basiliense]